MFIARAVAVVILAFAGAPAAPGQENRAPIGIGDLNAEAVQRGRSLVVQACSGCHAVGREGDSPMAEATPFREIVRRYPLDQLEEGFAEGLVTSHPAMPDYIFRASEIDDLIAYLESVRDDGR